MGGILKWALGGGQLELGVWAMQTSSAVSVALFVVSRGPITDQLIVHLGKSNPGVGCGVQPPEIQRRDEVLHFK